MNTDTESEIEYVHDGRGGNIYFRLGDLKLSMWYELAMPPAIIIVGIVEPKHWEGHTKTPLSRREEILGIIGDTIIKDKLSGEGYYLLDDNILSICPGRNPAAK